jgi:hypothetical protein
MNDKVGLKGSLTIFLYEKEKLIEKYYYENLITDDGLNYLLKLVGNDMSGGINKLALGSGNTTPTKSDKTLSNKLLLVDVQRDYNVPGRVNFLANVKDNTFNTIVNYTEAGLVYKSSTSEILVSRVVFNDVVFQKPENSVSFLYSLEIRA